MFELPRIVACSVEGYRLIQNHEFYKPTDGLSEELQYPVVSPV